MKAIVVEHLGEAGSLKEIPAPRPGRNDILVRVTAAGVNPIDWKRRDRPEQKFPFVLGQDFAGVVSEPGERARKYREGERIFGIAHAHGAYAEFTVVPEDDREQPVAKIPDSVGDAEAAALPTAGLTALAALEALKVDRGTTLLVLGATGGVGSFAVQMAHDRGARVAGTASAANEQLARSLGVDEFVAYDRDDPVATLKHLLPKGVDAALDLVDDPDDMKRLADLLRPGGAVISTIGSADVEWFKARNIAAHNLALMQAPQFSHAGLRKLLELVVEGRVRVMISGERALQDAIVALEESRNGSVDGKLVLTVD